MPFLQFEVIEQSRSDRGARGHPAAAIFRCSGRSDRHAIGARSASAFGMVGDLVGPHPTSERTMHRIMQQSVHRKPRQVRLGGYPCNSGKGNDGTLPNRENGQW